MPDAEPAARPRRARGPAARSFGNGLPTAIAWGLGLGIYGLVIAGFGDGVHRLIQTSPDVAKLLQPVFPGTDILSVGGFLQLLFVQFGLILAGLAAATLVGAWASDETSGRLEMLLGDAARARALGVSGGLGDPRRDRRLHGDRRDRDRDRDAR